MHWIVASLFSAFFLGWYELSGKHAVRENAVLPVLLVPVVWELSRICDGDAGGFSKLSHGPAGCSA